MILRRGGGGSAEERVRIDLAQPGDLARPLRDVGRDWYLLVVRLVHELVIRTLAREERHHVLVVGHTVPGRQFAEQPRPGVERRLYFALLVGVRHWLIRDQVNLEEPGADQRQVVGLGLLLDRREGDEILLGVPVLGIVGTPEHRGDAVPEGLAGQQWRWGCGRPACAWAVGGVRSPR